MQTRWNRLAELLTGEDGVTAIEYALLGSLIAAAIAAAVTALGLSVGQFYEFVARKVADAAPKT